MTAFLHTLWQRLTGRRSARTPQHSATTMRHRTIAMHADWSHTAGHPADVDRIGRAVGRAPVNQRG